ncbi:hypothetical protein [Brevibacterium samyangense]|uniref:Sulfotransferase family protein n=1 Tax=Brevibacterium samyangense TaxID=366888 RepID=A0ABN2TLM4_9MICO
MRIILHIGMGKTGSTSIQETLEGSDAELQKHGIAYLGAMLEKSERRTAPWQHPSADLNAAYSGFVQRGRVHGRERLLSEVCEAFDAAAAVYEARGIHTLVWSNERFISHTALFLAIATALRNRGGHDVKAVAYVRRHENWQRSVFMQWHVKMKRNSGENLSFHDFVRRKSLKFAPALEKWDYHFGEDFLLRNFDAVGSVSADFLSLLGIEPGTIPEVRANDSITDEDALLRILYNHVYNSGAHVDALDALRYVKPDEIDFSADPWELARSVWPTDDDVRFVTDSTVEDRARVDALLDARGQTGLESSRVKTRDFDAEPAKVLSALFQMNVSLRHQVNKLTAQTRKLEARLDALS